MHRSSPLALVGLVALAGCGREPQPAPRASRDRTATVFVDGNITRFTLDSCGPDGEAFHLTGQGSSGESLEAVVEILGDGETAAPAESSGITVLGLDQGDLSAVGAKVWAQRGMTGEPPGDMAAARITGDLIQMAGQRIAVIDEAGHPTGDEVPIFSLDAYCDLED